MYCCNSDMHSYFHSSLKVHNLCWRGTAESCHFWLVLLSIGATVHVLCTVDQNVAEEFYCTKNKYTSLHNAIYHGKDCRGVKFFICCYLLEVGTRHSCDPFSIHLANQESFTRDFGKTWIEATIEALTQKWHNGHLLVSFPSFKNHSGGLFVFLTF